MSAAGKIVNLESTWLPSKTALAAIIATVIGAGTLLWAAFDFKHWVSNELHTAREETIGELNRVNMNFAVFQQNFLNLASDVSEIKTAIKEYNVNQSKTASRMDKLESWKEHMERNK